MRYLLFPLVGLLAMTCTVMGAEKAPTRGKLPPPAKKKIDFVQDIQPILTRACVSCHGPKKQRGGLRLDRGDEARKGGNSGPVLKPGNAHQSRLLTLVAGLDPEMRMPPRTRRPLSVRDVSLLRAWIEQGANWPQSGAAVAVQRTSDHWAFQPIRKSPPPSVPPQKQSWMRNPIDAFVLARLHREGIDPAPEAERTTLLRRVSLDLTGLPPTPEEVLTFLQDDSPDAYEKAVDRLLASPAYGERWARHWLDLARYADSDGYEKDRGRPYAWRWRNWVIKALNRDLPFDQFTIEQLAGDLLPGATLAQKTATGFHRNTLTNTEGGVDKEQFRVEAVIDRVNTTGQVFLGLTLGCVQCHDHKYDPLTQREYYQFFAFFNSDKEVNLPAPLPEYKSGTKGKKGKRKKGKPIVRTLALGKQRKTHVLIRGDFLRKGVKVQPDTPAVLPPMSKTAAETTGASGSKTPTRLDLARWITDSANPLTPRVTTNWVWHKFFGRGLVATLEDFGTRGEKPSHPELLDWLARTFVEQGWSLKKLHRLIVTSATYRQSSRTRPELMDRDPLNVLLARQARHRLEAEILRDVSLASSGLLALRVGGPSVRPPQPAGVSSLTYANSARWTVSKGADRYRRGLYIWFQRTSPYPMLITFDAPDANVCKVKRERSNTPLQALTLLNDRVFVECAQGLAQRVLQEQKGSTMDRLRYAWLLCLSRQPSQRELARVSALYKELYNLAKKQPTEAAKLAGRAWQDADDVAEAAAWVALARTLMNLDEFVTRE